MLTNLVYSSWSVDGVISEESVEDYCKADTEEKEAFLQAVDNTAGCLVDAQCFIQRYINKVYFDVNATITEGAFGATAINGLCKAEQKGVILPVGGCDDVLDACDAINGDGLLGAPLVDDVWYEENIKPAFTRLLNANLETSYFTADVIAREMKSSLPATSVWNQVAFMQTLRRGIITGDIFAITDASDLTQMYTCN